MNVIEKLVAQRVYELVEAERGQIRRDATQSGFELGIEAQKEYYRLGEKPVSKEATHKLKCPSCGNQINVPCINFVRSPEALSNQKEVRSKEATDAKE